ncbi:MAG TPA: organomercurial lyase [Gemmatimonadaceae bacterium]|nr:organomercurial lyase [Gemmatimonadaceae bacterium]
MDSDTQVKLEIYRYFAETAEAPTVATLARRLGTDSDAVRRSFAALRAARVLYLEPDAETIRMAPPFSGVPTQHVVEIGARRWFANCAWDALGVVAALHQTATVHSECAQSGAPLRLQVATDGPEPCPWIFHSLVPAARWWDDLVFT